MSEGCGCVGEFGRSLLVGWVGLRLADLTGFGQAGLGWAWPGWLE